jgi:hypothetical protein
MPPAVFNPRPATGVCPPTWAGGELDACRSAGLRGRRRPAPRHARTGDRRGAYGRSGLRDERRREQRWLRGGAGARAAACTGAKSVRGRRNGFLRRRPNPLPRRPGRAGARGRALAARAALGRKERRARRGPGGAERARAKAGGEAARRRGARGFYGPCWRRARARSTRDERGSVSSATC